MKQLLDAEWLDTYEAADLLKKTYGCLATWRSRGKGPQYFKVGGSVYYLRTWINQWLKSRVIDPEKQAEVSVEVSQ